MSSYSPAAWVEAMRHVGGNAEQVGLSLATLADDEGRLPAGYTAGLCARLGLPKGVVRAGMHVLRSSSAVSHREEQARLIPEAITGPARPAPATTELPKVWRFDSDRGAWEAPVELGDYLRRKVAA